MLFKYYHYTGVGDTGRSSDGIIRVFRWTSPIKAYAHLLATVQKSQGVSYVQINSFRRIK